jgi:uncharacterized membrane protein YccC
VAGFLAPLVWSATYGKVDHAFHYAVFRYLETSAGIIIYTLVSALLWPRRAGDQLNQQGKDLWAGVRELFGMYRRQLADGQLPAEASDLRTRLAGTSTKMLTTLRAAYSDTPSVIAQKRAWEVLRVNLRALGDALELWRESMDDCRRLDLDRLLPRLGAGVNTLDRRLERIGDLWPASQVEDGAVDTGDGDRELLEPLGLAADPSGCAELPHYERAALLSFVQQFEVLDVTSRELLRTMRVLAGLDRVQVLGDRALPPDLYRPARWDPERLIKALFPALCFAAAYIFWIYADPPTGPSVPMMAATFALSILLTPMKALALLPVLLGAVCFAVAPVYFFVMPRLDTGFGLLALIFGYTFFFGCLGGRSPILKTVAVALFAMMTGISNNQTYSFIGLVNGAMMFVLALGNIAVVQMLVSPLQPEQILLKSLRRFFHGCAQIISGFALHRPEDRARGRKLRKRYYESMVLPVPRRLQAVVKKLDFKACPDERPEKMQRLLDGLQAISYRLQALELAHARAGRSSSELTEPLASLGRQLRERVQHVFEDWARFERGDTLDERAALQSLSRDLEQQLDTAVKRGDRDQLNDQALTNIYGAIGCARGLIEAMAETKGAVARINWDRWAEARF